MRFLKTTLGLTAGILCLACQSNTYKIDGFAHEANDGDTICMAYESRADKPFAITTVDNGKFMFTGETDSATLCRIYPKHHPNQEVTLFLEPGGLTVELSSAPALNRVSGSKVNNQWQLLSDSIRLMGEEAVRIARQTALDSMTQQQHVRSVDSLHRRMSACIENTARRNKANSLGKYIQANYKKPEFK